MINLSLLTHDTNNINHLISDVMDAFDEPDPPGFDFNSGRLIYRIGQPKLLTKIKPQLGAKTKMGWTSLITLNSSRSSDKLSN